ncbi:MAG TPA: M48 family metallopeptidase [Methylomirabilota bacterium]|jgi:Zn-dependent protease with chaperone function|nr:M48 family metallopeptidase [Methylomirabilota bacterium]
MSRAAKTAAVAFAALFAVACAGPVAGPPQPTSTGPENTRVGSAARSGRPVDPRDAERLQRIMVPLIRAMDHPRQLSNIKVGIMDDTNINAANAGDGEFYVTRGLLEKANDQQLMGVLAHEIAHEDLNHVAKAQRLGAGLNIGMVLLDQLIPGSSAISPIAGQLISRGYSRREEYQADAHGAELLRRVGSSKQVMIDTLQWLLQMEGGKSGGFFATHPATAERIEALREAK